MEESDLKRSLEVMAEMERSVTDDMVRRAANPLHTLADLVEESAGKRSQLRRSSLRRRIARQARRFLYAVLLRFEQSGLPSKAGRDELVATLTESLDHLDENTEPGNGLRFELEWVRACLSVLPDSPAAVESSSDAAKSLLSVARLALSQESVSSALASWWPRFLDSAKQREWFELVATVDVLRVAARRDPRGALDRLDSLLAEKERHRDDWRVLHAGVDLLGVLSRIVPPTTGSMNEVRVGDERALRSLLGYTRHANWRVREVAAEALIALCVGKKLEKGVLVKVEQELRQFQQREDDGRVQMVLSTLPVPASSDPSPTTLPFQAAAVINKCKCQLILMDAAFDAVMRFYYLLTEQHYDLVLSAILSSVQFARVFNMDRELRERLWKVGFMADRQSTPPELFFQETHGLKLYLQIQIHIFIFAAKLAQRALAVAAERGGAGPSAGGAGAEDEFEADELPEERKLPVERDALRQYDVNPLQQQQEPPASSTLPAYAQALGNRRAREYDEMWRGRCEETLFTLALELVGDLLKKVKRDDAEDQRYLKCLSVVMTTFIDGFTDFLDDQFLKYLPVFYYPFVELVTLGTVEIRQSLSQWMALRLAKLLPLAKAPSFGPSPALRPSNAAVAGIATSASDAAERGPRSAAASRAPASPYGAFKR